MPIQPLMSFHVCIRIMRSVASLETSPFKRLFSTFLSTQRRNGVVKKNKTAFRDIVFKLRKLRLFDFHYVVLETQFLMSAVVQG